jgi:hypothetical protein
MSLRRQNPEAGVALVAVILILALLMALAASVTTTITMDTALRGAFSRTTGGFYAAESGLDRGMGGVKDMFMAFHVPIGSDFNAQSFTLNGRTVTYQLTDPGFNPQTVQIPLGQLFGGLNASQYVYVANSQASSGLGTEANVGAEFDVGYIPIFQFIAFYANDLEIEPGADMVLNGRVHTNGNLYLNSDASLTIQDNPPNVTMVQVTAKGDIYRGRKDANTCAGTVTVDKAVDANGNGRLDPLNLNCSGTSTRLVPASELSSWVGSMLSRIQSISIPQPDITTKGSSGTYWTNADLRIVLRLENDHTYPVPTWLGSGCPVGGNCQLHDIEVQNADGTQDATKTTLLRNFMNHNAYNNANSSNTFPAPANASSVRGTRPIFYSDVPRNSCSNAQANCYTPSFGNSNNNRIYNSIMGALGNFDNDYRRGAFLNVREGMPITMLNVNIHDLLDYNMNRLSATNRFFDPADATDGGLVIYLSVQGPDSGAMDNGYGVRVFGSSNLPFPAVASGTQPTGLTVVSDQPIYIQGDYNSTGTWKAASVVGDSINVLSNAYFCPNAATPNPTNCPTTLINDGQSYMSLSDGSRNASDTTINTAFLAGVDTTTSGNYNGGFENYPRFHEDWSSRTLTYLGSFVSLGTPLHVNGPWCGTGTTCNIYDPPTRNWNYESRFSNVATLPPLTPRFVYVQQIFFTENFQ